MTESSARCEGRVVVLSGSSSDSDWVAKITNALDKLGVSYESRIGSAHRVPQHVLELLQAYDSDDIPTVFITVAGMSDALSGLTDANVVSPVIACPPKSDRFGGLDVLSSLRTPPGVAPVDLGHSFRDSGHDPGEIPGVSLHSQPGEGLGHGRPVCRVCAEATT